MQIYAAANQGRSSTNFIASQRNRLGEQQQEGKNRHGGVNSPRGSL